MSVVSIRAALEMALNGMSPALSTAWENVAFAPVAGTPYQIVNVLFAEPENVEYGSRHREVGYMQVKLMYPLQSAGGPNGTAAIAARAELIRATFTRGNTFSSGGATVMVNRTPEIQPGAIEGDRYAINVIIRFYANI